MATFNTMAVVPINAASTPVHVVWVSETNPAAIAPTNVHVVWPTESNPVAIAPTNVHVVWPTAQDSIPDISLTLITEPKPSETVRVVLDPTGLAYRMRGYDSTLGREVFWNSPVIDQLGSAYEGPGPLIDVVVHMKLGT